jgi:hypothetical protein
MRLSVTLVTLGTAFLKDPIKVTIVRTVVIPRATRAGTASFDIQKESQDNTTMRNVGE